MGEHVNLGGQLAVGYAANFVDLSIPVQEDLIKRTRYNEIG